jgi:hypothetical protein
MRLGTRIVEVRPFSLLTQTSQHLGRLSSGSFVQVQKVHRVSLAMSRIAPVVCLR